MRYKTIITTGLILLSPFFAFADNLYTGVSSLTGTDNTSINSGAITNLDDNNTGTEVSVHSSGTMHFWWITDLGSSLPVTYVDLKQWSETLEVDNSFAVRYSDSPLTTSNAGTQCGSTLSSTQYPTKQDSTFTCTATARYWGFYRAGNFNTVDLYAGDFNIYGTAGGGGGGTSDMGSSTAGTTTAQLIGSTTIGFGIIEVFLWLIFLGYIWSALTTKKPWH